MCSVRQLLQKENDLTHLLSIREGREEVSKREWTETLREEGFASDAAFDAMIKKLEADLKKARKKDADGEDVENVCYSVAQSARFADVIRRRSLRRSPWSMSPTKR